MKGPGSTNPLKEFFLSFIAPMICLSIIIGGQRTLSLSSQKLEKQYIFIPHASVIKRFDFGFDNILSDIYWLRCIQYAAEEHYSENGLEWMYRSLDLITTLDRNFESAYLFGGIVLSSDGRYVEKSIKILEKGMRNLKDVWRFPFYIGFNYFFYLQKFELAAEYIGKASRIPGAPPYLLFLTTRLMTEAKKPETALEFLMKIYEEEKDPVIREKIEERVRRVTVERDIILLTGKVEEFRKEKGRYPSGLRELVSLGYLVDVPVEPYGGYYYLDRKTREVKSSKVKERLKLYR